MGTYYDVLEAGTSGEVVCGSGSPSTKDREETETTLASAAFISGKLLTFSVWTIVYFICQEYNKSCIVFGGITSVSFYAMMVKAFTVIPCALRNPVMLRDAILQRPHPATFLFFYHIFVYRPICRTSSNDCHDTSTLLTAVSSSAERIGTRRIERPRTHLDIILLAPSLLS